MATKKQVAANRRNARRSTGPKTPRGKARSSRNAMTHGLCSRQVLLREEDPDLFRQVWQGVLEDLRPRGELETYLACRVAAGIWRMNRIVRIEAQLFNESPLRIVEPDAEIGGIFRSDCANGANAFAKLCRYETAIDRGIQRALKELRAIRAARGAAEEAGFLPEPAFPERSDPVRDGAAAAGVRPPPAPPGHPGGNGSHAEFPIKPDPAPSQAGQGSAGDQAAAGRRENSPPHPAGKRRIASRPALCENSSEWEGSLAPA
jgi:hypothetical protein